MSSDFVSGEAVGLVFMASVLLLNQWRMSRQWKRRNPDRCCACASRVPADLAHFLREHIYLRNCGVGCELETLAKPSADRPS